MSRVAVILPVAYRGGTLRAAKDVARMLRSPGGSPALDVVFALPAGDHDGEPDLADLRALDIGVRAIEWRMIERENAARMAAASLAPFARPLVHARYGLPSDGAADLLDCDFWLFVSDRVAAPLLPIRPYGVLVFDCLQRYVPTVHSEAAWRAQVDSIIPFVREADVVLVTTPATRSDVLAFTGVPAARIRQVPLFFAPPAAPAAPPPVAEPYLVWATNRSSHRNHWRTLRGLMAYYEDHRGRLKTVVLGTETEHLVSVKHPDPMAEGYLGPLRDLIGRSRALRENLVLVGEVSAAAYAAAVAGARCLLHSSLYDNGTFTVLDAAYLGVPSLSARYPAMEHLDRTFELGLAWFDPFDAEDLARGLAAMERRAEPAPPPPRDRLDQAHWSRCAAELRRVLAPWVAAAA